MTKKYELYEILSDCEKLKKLREEYINSLSGNFVSKIVSTKQDWFFYNQGVYVVEKELKGAFFEMEFFPTSLYYKSFISDFVLHGPSCNEFVKGISYDGKDKFIYTNSAIVKRGKNYTVSPAFEISEDLYNLSKIQFRDFGAVTTEDLGKYSEFFIIGDNPYMIIDEVRIEDLYRTGQISRADYKDCLEKYEIEERLVKTLRKK